MNQDPNAPIAQQPAPQPASGQPPAPGGAQRPAPAAENVYLGFSIGAVITAVGSLLALVAYPLVWWSSEDDASATITGFGSTSTDRIVYESGKGHWLPLAAALVLLVLAGLRLAGRWQPTLNRAAVIIGVLGLLSALLAVFVVSEGFTPEIGAYLVLVGMIVALAGVVTIAVAKK